MAEVTQLKRYDARPINWGKWFLIGIGMLVSAFILLVPMIYIFVQAFSKAKPHRAKWIFPEGNRTLFARNVVDWSMKQTLTRGLVLD